MGHPKKQRKKYESPKKPWDKARLEEERKLSNEYGLRRKHEILRSQSILRDFRRRARELQASYDKRRFSEMITKLKNLGISCETLDDVLGIKIEDILSRRLQTIVYKKNITNTVKQARQLIVHGHVFVNARKIVWPSYLVPVNEEGTISVSDKITTLIKKEVTQ